MPDLPLLPTTVIGSHGKPGWWFTAVRAWENGEYGSGDLEEMLDDAVATMIRDQEDAGLDIITDGEGRRLDGYVDTYYAVIRGIEKTPVARKAGPWGYDQQQRYVAVEEIHPPEGGLGIVREFSCARRRTKKPMKVTCAGPLTFGSRIHPGGPYKTPVEVAERFARVINEELKALVEAGADYIQIDEPARGHGTGEEMARLFNMATEGVKAKLGYHICFGNRHGRTRFPSDYRPYLPGLAGAKCAQIALEFAAKEMTQLDVWKEHLGDKELGAGVIDVKSFHIETPEEVAVRIRKVLEYFPPERVYLNPDCGFGWNPRYQCVGKLRALVEGAAIVRKELAG